MEVSGLQFRNPRLVNLHFTVNNGYQKTENESVNIDVGFSKNICMQENKEAIVELSVQIGSKDEKSPFFIEATEGALFMWTEAEESLVDIYLNQNAPAVLLGYLRPIVAMITASSPFPAYNLPLINFKD